MGLFQKIRTERTRSRLIKNIKRNNAGYIVDKLSDFSLLSHNEIAQSLIATGNGRYVAVNFSKFNSLNESTVAELEAKGFRIAEISHSKVVDISSDSKTLIEEIEFELDIRDKKEANV